MKRAILIFAVCIISAFLIFEVSRYTARKDYDKDETNQNTELAENSDESQSEFTGYKLTGDDILPEDSESAQGDEQENNDNTDSTDSNESTDVEVEDGGVNTDTSDETVSASEGTGSQKADADAQSTTDSSNLGGKTELIDKEDEGDSDNQKEEAEEKKILIFLDAYGESHQMEVNQNVKKHDYYLSSFYRFTEYASYEGDDRYSYKLGIDVSHHSGDIDFQAVKDSGIDFVFLRIGYRGYGESGSLNEDKMFRKYIDKAHEAGLEVGCYFYSQAINTDEAQEEAQMVLGILKDYKLELPVVFDPENVLDDVARTDDVSGEQFTQNTLVFCNLIDEAGYEPMVYSNLMWEAYQFDMEKISKYPIWYADYEPTPQTPYDFVCWQYSNTGEVPGVSGDVDLDIWLTKN